MRPSHARVVSCGRGGRFEGSCGCFLCPLVGMQALCCPRRRAELRRGCPRSWATAARCPAIARCRMWPQRRWRFDFAIVLVCVDTLGPPGLLARKLVKRCVWEDVRLGKHSGFIVGEILTIIARTKPCKAKQYTLCSTAASRHRRAQRKRWARRGTNKWLSAHSHTYSASWSSTSSRVPLNFAPPHAVEAGLNALRRPRVSDDEDPIRSGARNQSGKNGQGHREARI